LFFTRIYLVVHWCKRINNRINMLQMFNKFTMTVCIHYSVVFVCVGADFNVSCQHWGPRHVPCGTHSQYARLLKRYLLCRARHRKVTDSKHSRRILVGHNHYDNSRLRWQGSGRANRADDRGGVRYFRYSNARHSGSDHRWTLQSVLRA